MMISESSTSSPTNMLRANVNTGDLGDIVKKQKQCMSVFSCIVKLVLSSALVIWIIFAIIALSGEHMKDIKDECPKSKLWPCLCTMVGVTLLNIFIDSKPRDKDGSKFNLVGFCFIIGAFVWMSIELFDVCAVEKLNNYEIYHMLFILYWIYVGIFSLLVIVIICICCGADGRDPSYLPESGGAVFSNDALEV